MRKMFLVTYLTRNERFLRFLLNMYISLIPQHYSLTLFISA